MIGNLFKQALSRYGEPVELHPKNGRISYIRASVQSEVQEPLVNDYDQSKFIVYISPLDVPEKPLKFDRMLVRGETYALDEDAKVEYLNGVPVMYVVRIMG